MVKHFLDISDLSAADLRAILDDAHARKKARLGWPKGRVDADAPAQLLRIEERAARIDREAIGRHVGPGSGGGSGGFGR